MSKRSKNQSSLLSLGVKRICYGEHERENSSEGQDDSESSTHGGGHNHPDEEDIDTIDEVVECSSDCCKPDREGTNQPKSSLILAATKRIQSQQARYVQAVWFNQHPWFSLCETRKKNIFASTAQLP